MDKGRHATDAEPQPPDGTLESPGVSRYNGSMPQITAEQHQRLLAIVLECLEGRNVEVLEGGWAVADHDRGGVYGLVNLYQELQGIPDEEWPGHVQARLTSLGELTPDLPATYEAAAPRLRIRLSPDGSDPGWAAYRRVCDGLDQILMMRNEVGCVTVGEETVAGWGVSLDAVFAEALARTVWDEPRERRVLAQADLRLVWIRANFFASSVLLHLQHLLSPKNRYGALAMAPCRDALLYTEIKDDRVVRAAAGLIEVGNQWFATGPGSISPDVFWARTDGTVVRVVEAKELGYEPCWGRDFSAVLAELERAHPPAGRSARRKSRDRA